jgi:hypothetical protein
VKGCLIGRKWTYLVNLSTTTKIALYLSDCVKPSMKSKLTVSLAWVGTCNGFSSPGVFILLVFAYWHTWHCFTKSCMNCFIPGQWNNCLTLTYVAPMPEWPPTPLSCKAIRISLWATMLLRIHTLPLYLMTASFNVYPFPLSLDITNSISSYWAIGSSL